MYNEDISDYIEDALEDMKTSGVPPDILKKYRKKVFRMTLEGSDLDVE